MNNPCEFSLAFGYYASLTGISEVSKIEMIANSFEIFCLESNVKFGNWIEAWNQFWKA